MMNNQQKEREDVRQFEQMIGQMFDVRASQDQRQTANKQLMKMCSNLSFASLALSVFKYSASKAALANASSALLQLVSNHWNSFPKDQILTIRTYIYFKCLLRNKNENDDERVRAGTTIQHVLNNRRGIPHDGTAGMIRILCRITKLGWFENDTHKKLVLEIQKFLQHTIDAAIIGLRILNELVIEMNTTLPGQTATAARKTAVSFKDECLFHIFQCSLSMLRQIQENKVNIQNEQQAHDIRKFSLEAAKSVLMFDFIGTNPDESCGEVGTVQVPLSWRSILQDPQTLRLLFEFYEKNQEPHSAKCLELLVYLASVRRSVFSNETERKNFLNRLLEGVRDILRFSRGLNGPDNFHQFCRLLGKVKMNYQLSELVSSDGYMNFIELLSNFTGKSFEMYKYSNRSTHYLLQLWDRIVSATPYVVVVIFFFFSLKLSSF
jgi:exportin-7